MYLVAARALWPTRTCIASVDGFRREKGAFGTLYLTLAYQTCVICTANRDDHAKQPPCALFNLLGWRRWLGAVGR
eukprot:COSAG02_NODE_1642_length_11529_cov_4.449606_5_plen_75_part_00